MRPGIVLHIVYCAVSIRSLNQLKSCALSYSDASDIYGGVLVVRGNSYGISTEALVCRSHEGTHGSVGSACAMRRSMIYTHVLSSCILLNTPAQRARSISDAQQSASEM